MNIIKLEIFGKEAECLSFSSSKGPGLTFDFGKEISGFVTVGSITRSVFEGLCTLDGRILEDGEYEPTLILDKKTVRLPKIVKREDKIRLAECSDDYIRRLSLRERRLALRLEELERRILEICERIGSSSALKLN